jgi:hypothetical protein
MTGAAASEAAPHSEARAADLFTRMSWMNEPESSKRLGETMVVHSRPKTDFWRKTFYGYITDNGHFSIWRPLEILRFKPGSMANIPRYMTRRASWCGSTRKIG